MFDSATAFQQSFFCQSVTSGPPSSCNNTLDDYSLDNAMNYCLAEAPVDGLCTKFGSARKIGTVPNWNTSLVTNMNGCTRSGSYCTSSSSSYSSYRRMFNRKSSFNGDISNIRRIEDIFREVRVSHRRRFTVSSTEYQE